MTAVDDHVAFIQQRWPELNIDTIEPMGGGWDRFTYLVNGEWVFQFPRLEGTADRRLEGAADRLRRQIAILPELAREVSSAVPTPAFASVDPPCLGYRRIDGRQMSQEVDGIWPERLGRFLYDLHMTPPEFLGMRSLSASAVWDGLRDEVASLAAHVLPLLDPAERTGAERAIRTFLDDDLNFRFAACVIHGDIGPEHVLVADAGDLAGVIDWGDIEVGNPASDLAWVINAWPEVGARVLGAYGGAPDDRFLVRARFAYMLMPWHEVKYGLETDQHEFVRSGMAGVRDRLL